MLEVVQALCAKVRAVAAVVEDNMREMRGRTASGLLRLARQHGRTSPDCTCLQLAFSQEELGKYLGMSRENVNRQLGQLKLATVITISGSEIRITDEKGLLDIAQAPSKEYQK
jgi:CRP/FNR family transcriptional regulator, cyclic AMP receptor protein